MKNAVIVSALRTPVGRYKGALSSIPAYKLGAIVVEEAVKQTKLEPDQVDQVIFGNLFSHDIANMARMVSLEAGLPVQLPGITLDRQCSSSLDAIAYASLLIQCGYAQIVIAGGCESDSTRPFVMEKQADAFPRIPPSFLNLKLAPEKVGDPPMGITAENVAIEYSVGRDECDEFALNSHKKAATAWDAGFFDNHVVPVEIALPKGEKVVISKDEKLKKLRPAFQENGVVTAGNSSPMSDGAAAVIIMEEKLAEKMGLDVLAMFKNYTVAGVDPKLMGIGPVPATNALLDKEGLSIDDIDLIELNEAFAAQSIPCIKELGIDSSRLNVNGGAIALGHPLAASGAIVTARLVFEMKNRDATKGLVTFCCGGGQGVALLFTRK